MPPNMCERWDGLKNVGHLARYLPWSGQNLCKDALVPVVANHDLQENVRRASSACHRAL
jgi:hypothetical protein